MEKNLNNIMFIFPVMFYYAIEALIVGIFISFIWKFLLSNYFGNLEYFQIVGIYWIFKMLFFDVFKLIASLASMSNQVPQPEEENKYEQ